jgi:soluble lytic murein transglycosylase-like protein
MTRNKHYKTKWDYTLICPCQHHARRERTLWRRSLRVARSAARQIGRRSIALLIGVPLAIGALELPSEAMNLSLPAQRAKLQRMFTPLNTSAQSSRFPIFTTPAVREEFLATKRTPQKFTVEVAKEQFFRTHVPYGSIIYREARRYDLAPELVAAVVEAESDFRPRLISHKNAQGLMQIIPSTGRLMGADDLFNPAENIAAGTRYLRYLVNRFGDQRLALAAYNAGEGNIEKFGGIPPFPETRNYLQRVNTHHYEYRQRVRGRYLAGLRMRNSVAVLH